MSERWKRTEDILLQAMDTRPEDRAAFLDQACEGDDELRREVESLLRYDGGSGFRMDAAVGNTVRSLLESTALAPGTRVGEYEVEKLIGSGSMGEVYQARDARLRRNVAIKVLPPMLNGDPERLRRFEQEARAAAALSHQNIVAVFQLGTYRGSPYLVLELLEGATLREQMRRSPMPLRSAVDYGVQIARGMAAAHEKGITHRDLKPENLFVTRDGRIKILDFGLAKLTRTERDSTRAMPDGETVTEPGLVMGTVGYMSPEQVRGEEADHRTDIFAFGAILFEMLSGKRAFQKSTAADTMSAILHEEASVSVSFPPSTPPALLRVVQRCLEKTREGRFQSASDLAFALEALSDSGLSGSGGAYAVPGAVRNRSRTLWAGTAAVALIAGALAVWRQTPAARPQVEAVRQLTDDGEPKATTLEAAYGSLAADGARVYLNEKHEGGWRIAQVSAAGGQTAPAGDSAPFPIIAGMNPDGSGLLTLGGWRVPLPAGNPRRLADLAQPEVTSSAYFPDGRRIVYAKGPALYTCDANGENSRKVADVPAEIRWLAVSRDGKRIRFTYLTEVQQTIREINADGMGMRGILDGWKGADTACCGKWTRDERYFVFLGRHDSLSDIWAIREGRSPLPGSAPTPVRLTNGPLSYYEALPGPDSRTIYAIGAKQRGELNRFDAKLGLFVPYLGGISATDVDSSPDGQWVVFLSYPDSILWRSHPDGGARMQLSNGRAFYPRLSPDGSNVTFIAWDAGKGLGSYVVSVQGGSPRRVADKTSFGAWSPDGKQLVLQFNAAPAPESSSIRTLNPETGETHDVPDSAGMFVPMWLDARTVVAKSSTTLMAFDFGTRKWSQLVQGNSGNWLSSADAKAIYFEKDEGGRRKVFQFRMADRSLRAVADLSGLKRVEQYGPGTWLGIAPDGSVLITRDTGSQELYALDVRWP